MLASGRPGLTLRRLPPSVFDHQEPVLPTGWRGQHTHWRKAAGGKDERKSSFSSSSEFEFPSRSFAVRGRRNESSQV